MLLTFVLIIVVWQRQMGWCAAWNDAASTGWNTLCTVFIKPDIMVIQFVRHVMYIIQLTN